VIKHITDYRRCQWRIIDLLFSSLAKKRMFLKEKKQWQFDVRENLTMKEAEDTNFSLMDI